MGLSSISQMKFSNISLFYFVHCRALLEENNGNNQVLIQMANKEDEEPYVLNMDVMEDDFYDGMYSFLEDRGITEEFCEELITICTDMEANNYRQLLVDMKSFVE